MMFWVWVFVGTVIMLAALPFIDYACHRICWAIDDYFQFCSDILHGPSRYCKCGCRVHKRRFL